MSQCKVISVCNQKGGVGKTTTTINLGAGLIIMRSIAISCGLVLNNIVIIYFL